MPADPFASLTDSSLSCRRGRGCFDGWTSLAPLNADQRSGVADNGKSSMTIDQAASNLVGGLPGWSSALGMGFTVTYGFRATAPASMPSDTDGFSQFNAAQIDQAELAMKAWSDVANIHFVRVGAGDTDRGGLFRQRRHPARQLHDRRRRRRRVRELPRQHQPVSSSEPAMCNLGRASNSTLRTTTSRPRSGTTAARCWSTSSAMPSAWTIPATTTPAPTRHSPTRRQTPPITRTAVSTR